MTPLTKIKREVRSHCLRGPLIVELRARPSGEGAILTMWEKHCRGKYSVSVVELFQRLVYEEVKRRK